MKPIFIVLLFLVLAIPSWPRGQTEAERALQSPQGIFDWLHENIEYIPDDPPTVQRVQPPEYTIQTRTGDCEDIALAYLWLLNQRFQYDQGRLVLLEHRDRPGEPGHMVVLEGYHNVYQDPTYYWQKTEAELLADWVVVRTYTLEQYLHLAYAPENLALVEAQGRVPK